MMVSKCFVIGSCVSRDMFNSKFVSEYKDSFELQVMQFQMSMLSILEPPISYPGALWDSSKMTINNYSHMRSELNKKVLAQLILHQPEFLIMDFFADAEHGAIKISNGAATTWVTDKRQIFSQNPLWTYFDIEDECTPNENFSRFYKVWQLKFDEFLKWATENIPNTEIIVNRARFATHLKNANGDLEEISSKLTLNEIREKNNRWEQLSTYAIKTHNLRSLEYGSDESEAFPYLGDSEHMWGRYIAHFENAYYRDMFGQMKKISKTPQKERTPVLSRSVQQLVPNNKFELESASWEIDPGFVYVGDGMSVEKSVAKDGPYATTNLKSDAIQLNLKAPTDFMLEADYEIDLRATHADRAVLFVRGFNRYQEQTFATSTENHEFFVSDFIEEAKAQTCDVETRSTVRVRLRRKVTLNSKFVRVVSYMGNKGKMKVNELSLYTM